MKKFMALLLCLLISIPAFALAESTSADIPEADAAVSESSDMSASDAVLIEAARGMVDDLLLLGSADGLSDMYLSMTEATEVLTETVSHDYSEPEHTAVLAFKPDAVNNIMKLIGQTPPSSDVDAARLNELVCTNFIGTLPGILNAQYGAIWPAISSILHVTDIFTLDGVPEGIAYVICDYGEEQPLTCASFRIKADGMTMCTAQFIQADEDARGKLFGTGQMSLDQALSSGLISGLLGGITHNVYG